jgi:hypothetical protein
MLQAGNRKKKLFIPALTNASDHTVTGQQQKEEIVFEHFVRMMGTPEAHQVPELGKLGLPEP